MASKFSKVHVAIIVMALFTMSPPAQASIVQVITTIVNFINTNIAGFSGVIQSMGQGANTQVNSDKQSTEVLAGTIAEQTKTLGSLKYKLNFGSFGSLGQFKINGVAPGGCFGKKRDASHKKFLEIAENTEKNVLPTINEYAGVHDNFDYKEDTAERKAVLDLMKQHDFPLEGLLPSSNITEAQRALYSRYVQFITVPSPITISGVGRAGSTDEKSIATARYQALVGILQKAMLDYGDRYLKFDDSTMSRYEMMEAYGIYANSDKRIKSTNLKTSAGVERELAEAQSMTIDVESEIMKSQDNILGLMTILAIKSTDEVADEL